MYTSIAFDISKFDAYGLLPGLLIDHATGGNIRWSTDAYTSLHDYGYAAENQIDPIVLLGMEDDIVKIRAEKTQDLKSDRTKQRAEVFTPRWVCSYMIDELDLAWLEENGIEIGDAASNEEDAPEKNVTCATGSETSSEVWSEPLEYWYLPFEDDEPEDEDRTEADSDKAKSDGHELSEDYESRVVFSKIDMKSKGIWKKYVSLRKMEITCGEAPYIVTRYDAATGEPVDIEERIGMLDRKLFVIGQYAKDEAEWFRYAKKALKTTYGYEYQGDNLLIARINVVASVGEFFEYRWGHDLDPKQYKQVIEIVSWNLWQMDGLTGMTPCGALASESIFDDSLFFDEIPDDENETAESSPCKIRMWRRKKKCEDIIEFRDIGVDDGLEEGEEPEMKFDYVIGNPPYQEETQEAANRQEPIYHNFINESYQAGNKVMLITPARFLFNAGQTPKAWNIQMLSDEHLKVIYYNADASQIFANTDIKGGIAITYRDNMQNFGAIKHFIPYEELRTIVQKVKNSENIFLSSMIWGQSNFNLAEIYKDYPEFKERIHSGGKSKQIRSNAFEIFPELFFEKKSDTASFAMRGILHHNRVIRFIDPKYIEYKEIHDMYKVIIPQANGSGAIGEVLSTPVMGEPVMGEPVMGYTQSFISIGGFATEEEAKNCLKYIQTRFARAMLGTLKVTQNNASPSVWANIPVQNFTHNSDINWSKTINEINEELYDKYRLSSNERLFIENNIKPMDISILKKQSLD